MNTKIKTTKTIDRNELERRRMKAGKRFAKGKTPYAVAKYFNVSPGARTLAHGRTITCLGAGVEPNRVSVGGDEEETSRQPLCRSGRDRQRIEEMPKEDP